MQIVVRLILLIFCFNVINSKAQATCDSLQVSNITQMYSDKLGNFYLVSSTNDIEKYDKNGKKIATANFKILGNISYIDASNPFEIYVFYRDQNKVLYLDNLLSLRGETNLQTNGITQAACIARSYDNQLWVMDMGDLKLKKISKENTPLLESASFTILPISGDITPVNVLDVNNAIFILNSGTLYQFDIFGNFVNKVVDDSIAYFQYINNQLVYINSKNELKVYNPITYTLKEIEIPEMQKADKICITSDKIYILQSKYVILQPQNF